MEFNIQNFLVILSVGLAILYLVKKYNPKNENKNCGDKGISAGEGSIVGLDNGKINQALIGLVAKDGSTLSVNYAGLYDVDVCLSVYTKKQEYAGGLLKINNIDCPSNKYYSQTGSRIDMP